MRLTRTELINTKQKAVAFLIERRNKPDFEMWRNVMLQAMPELEFEMQLTTAERRNW